MELRDIVFAITSDLESWIEYYQATGDKKALDDILRKAEDLRTASCFILSKIDDIINQLEAEARNDQDTIRRIFDL